MKKIIAFFALSTLLFSCGGKSSSSTNSYGPVEVDSTKAISVQEFFNDFEQIEDSKDYTIKGKIVETCKKSGCWVGIDDGNNDVLTVNFKDHFSIPLDTKLGTYAYMHGTATWDSIPVAQLKEEALDDGKSQEEIDQITSPRYIFNFVADGITLKK
ncbi:MAG: DUF4920 domain-containing protein [Crocinitomicaceae bacterium]|nr:DUF4920 domain-containing protein [Crocinitomicaceae bacterium]